MSTPSKSSEKFIPSLDGWRAVAIILVFVSHAGLGKFVPGGLGVTIFFFLSGYLITTLTCREFDRDHTISIKHFYARRAVRLLPPLVVTLTLAYGLAYAGAIQGGYTVQGFISQLLYFANYYSLFFDTGNTTPAGTGIFWSLAVEEHFYFAFPVIFLVLRQLKNKLAFAIFLTVTCLVVLAWRIYLIGIVGVHESRTYYATDTRIDSIIFGCLLALIRNPLEHKTEHVTLNSIDYVILGTSISALLFSIVYRNAFFRETIRYTVQGIALAPLFFYSIKHYRHFLFRPLQSQFMQRIGVYSYSIYLIHYILLERLRNATPLAVLDATLAAVLSLTFAFAIDKHVDKPLHQLKRRLY